MVFVCGSQSDGELAVGVGPHYQGRMAGEIEGEREAAKNVCAFSDAVPFATV
jgi:hypothetical protein